MTSDVVRYANGAISQCEVSWAFGGGMDLRDEVSGTERTNWREGIPSHIWKIPSFYQPKIGPLHVHETKAHT